MRLKLICFLFLFSMVCRGQGYNLIPYPQVLEPGQGQFVVNAGVRVVASPGFEQEGVMLRRLLEKALGKELNGSGNEIRLVRDAGISRPEGYRLVITPRRIELRAGGSDGIFHGIETIRQLLPVTAERGKVGDPIRPRAEKRRVGDPIRPRAEKRTVGDPIGLPALRIEDYPVYSWRGMHLDVSRHFFSIDYLRRFIDRMALYKMNKLHLHLSDDQGWRVEIKHYPLLTAAGAWRTMNNQDSACMRRAADDPDFAIDSSHLIRRDGNILYGGFYTQEQLRALVAYARERHIDIIPEIDMPGHMMAAINSYPFLTCNGENKWGELFTKPICPCNETTFTFAENVFSEIMDIFPSHYIHIGGDEVDRSDWAKSAACKELMEKQGIKDLPGLQSYFISRMEKFFQSKGRELVGWDEIIEGPISPDALVMYWRGWVPGAPMKAARNGNRVVMAPGEPLYFDRPADQYDLSNVYHFNPVPKSIREGEGDRPVAAVSEVLKAKIIGGQACLWSEMLPNEKRCDYMYMPRMTALAEALWTARADGWESYLHRLSAHYPRMDALGINYRLPDLAGLLNEYMFTEHYVLSIPPPAEGLVIRYTTDGSRPTMASPVLGSPLVISSDLLVRVEAYSPSGAHGDIYDLLFRRGEMQRAVGGSGLQSGLECSVYKKYFKATTFMTGLKPDSVFVYDRVAVPSTVNAPSFGIGYKGYIDVPADGIYSFYLNCDDGGVLRIGNAVVVDNDGNHSARERSAQVILQKGLHPFRVDFIEGGGGYTLKLRYSTGGAAPAEIPAEWFEH